MLGGRQSPLLRLASAFETWILMKSISYICCGEHVLIHLTEVTDLSKDGTQGL